MATRGLHGIGKSICIVVAGAFENHVFEEMRDAGTKVLVLVHTSCGDPDLSGNDRGGRIGIEDESESVRQCFDGGGSGGIFHEILAWLVRWMTCKYL